MTSARWFWPTSAKTQAIRMGVAAAGRNRYSHRPNERRSSSILRSSRSVAGRIPNELKPLMRWDLGSSIFHQQRLPAQGTKSSWWQFSNSTTGASGKVRSPFARRDKCSPRAFDLRSRRTVACCASRDYKDRAPAIASNVALRLDVTAATERPISSRAMTSAMRFAV
jgi:hypothetical protein